MKRPRTLLAALLVGGVLAGCGDGGGDGGGEAEAPSSSEAAVEAGGGAGELTAEEMEKGIGPVREVELGALDASLAERGEQVFTTKCYACHRLDERYVAPALGGVLERRTPEYVMNMILNPEEMVQRHPAARELLAEFMTQMPNQGLSREEARAVLEYIRAHGSEAGAAGDEDTQGG